MTTAKILIVDDEPQNFDVFETLLADRAYRLFYAASGADALQMLDSIEPDVIVLDVMMPGLDGVELCRRLKASATWRHVPIIMVTALSEPRDLAHCLASGADDFMSKPVGSTELTARIQSMLRIKRQHDQLQALLRERASWMRTAAHDLRGSLGTIQLYTELLGKPDERESPERVDEYLQQITDAVVQMDKLVGRFLLVEKRDTVQIAVVRRPVNFALVLEKLVHTHTPYARSKKISLETRISTDTSCVIDADLLSQVCTNLISNALKYSPPHTTVRVGLERVDDRLRVTVHDEGLGFTAEDKARMFRPFTPLGAEPTGNERSTGLGLFIVHKLVGTMSGTIELESAGRSCGSKFVVTVPAVS